MKLDQSIVDYIFNVVKTAKLVNIDNIIIEPGLVRAMNDGRTVVLRSAENVPDLPFSSIGITRINDILARYEIVSKIDGFYVEAKTDSDGEYATQLILKAKRTKVDYRCGDPRTLNAPKQINDVMCHNVELSESVVEMLVKGAAAMGSENVSFISDNDGVVFKLADDNKDIFKCEFETRAIPIANAEGKMPSSNSFAHSYSVKTLLALFKNHTDVVFSIGQKGIISFPINGLTVYVIPQV